MEDIRIPELSVLMTYDKLLTDMGQFCAETGYEPQFTLTRNCPVTMMHEQSVFTMSSTYRSIRNHVLNTTRQCYKITSEGDHRDTFLSRDMQIELRQKKNVLLKVIHKHEAAMKKLLEASMKRSKTQAKTEEKAMNVVKKGNVFDRYIIYKNEKRLRKERRLREKLESIARDMESDICKEIKYVIVQLMEENDQIIESEELTKFTNTLYKQACRVYTFQIIEA